MAKRGSTGEKAEIKLESRAGSLGEGLLGYTWESDLL